MIRRALTWIAVLATIGTAVLIANAIAQNNHTVEAVGIEWVPNQLDAAEGDTVTFEFPAVGLPHNVAIRLAGDDDPPPEGYDFIITQGHPGCEASSPYLCPAGTDPVDWQVPPEVEDGPILYICTVHSNYDGDEDRWTGMVGTIGEDDDPNPRLQNPTEAPGPPWEVGTQPPRMLGHNVRGVRRGIRLRVRLSHPGRLNVRIRRGGRAVVKRNLGGLKQGANQRRIRNNRLRSGRYRVVLRYRDRWGIQGRPKVVRRQVRVKY